jgi:glycerol uptake operon antiterminator
LKKLFEDRLQRHKLIGAIKQPKGIEQAIKYKDNLAAVILMTGNVLTVKQYVDVLHQEGLPVILHLEKIDGIQYDPYGVQFICDYVKPFAIVTTKPNLTKRFKAKGLFVIQRVFLIDTEVYEQLGDKIDELPVDMVEIMPCRATDFIEKLAAVSTIPIITGGLLNKTSHAKEALAHGAKAVTTSNMDLWKTGLKEL